MQSYKIDVRDLTQKQKKDVQEAFFRLGYGWEYGGKLIKNESEDFSHNFYYVRSNGILTYGEYLSTFENKPFITITYAELMALTYGDNTMNTQKQSTKVAFTKASLKDGMFVRLKNERIYILTQGNLLNGSGWMPLESYDVDLKHDYDDNWSIVEAMELKHNFKKLGYGFSKIEEFEYNSIWKRPEQTEQQKQLAELKTAQEELLLKAKEIGDKIVALQQG